MKITYSAESIDLLLTDLFIESHRAPAAEIVLDLYATHTYCCKPEPRS